MAWFTNIPIVDVHRDNFDSLWPSIVLAIRKASFVALDAELSGLGPRKNLMLRSFDDRYKALRDVATSHSILSLGISCFRVVQKDGADSSDDEKVIRFNVQTFNITTLCSEDYMVEPAALRFLVEHAFDFNKQYSKGVSYYRGQDKPGNKNPLSPRELFTELLQSTAPIVLHNGLIDLAFLYQNLYCNLPQKASQFICDLSEMFRGGVLDTKYVADFEARMTSSYLEYVFRKCQRSNARHSEEGKLYVAIECPKYPAHATFVEYHACALPKNLIDGPEHSPKDSCEQYAAHGHCVNGIKCARSHDPDVILDEEEFKDVARKKKRNHKKRQRNRRKREQHGEDEPPIKVPCNDENYHGDKNQTFEEPGGIDLEESLCEEGYEVARTSNVNKDTAVRMGEDIVGAVGKFNGADDPREAITTQKIPDHANADVGIQETETMDQDTTSSNNKDIKDGLLLELQYAGCHRAGFDAFMTGFAMATFVSQYGHVPSSTSDGPSCNGSFVEHYAITDLVNKLYLGGRDVPLQITKSHFSKPSGNHREKMKTIFKT